MVMRRVPVLTAPGGGPVADPNWKPALQRVPPAPRLSVVWESWTGESWTITDRRSPIYALQGATGLEMGDPVHQVSEAAALHGSQWSGSRDPSGEVFLPVHIQADTTEEFLAVRSAYKRSLSRTRESKLWVITPTRLEHLRRRHLPLRYKSGGDQAMSLDPVMTRRAKCGPTLWAADPHWRGDPVVTRFEHEPETDFFPGPPFHFSRGVSLGNSPVVNPGDVDDVSHWSGRVEGPFTGITVGVGKALIVMSLTKTRGQWVDIDTDPERQTFTDETGADVSGTVQRAEFAPIPAGETEMVVEMAGATTGTALEVRFVPRYYEAF